MFQQAPRNFASSSRLSGIVPTSKVRTYLIFFVFSLPFFIRWLVGVLEIVIFSGFSVRQLKEVCGEYDEPLVRHYTRQICRHPAVSLGRLWLAFRGRARQ